MFIRWIRSQKNTSCRGRKGMKAGNRPESRSRPFLEALEDRFLPSVRYIATGADAGGGPHVKVYSPSGELWNSFFAYDSAFAAGVRVAVGDVTGDGIADIVTAPGPGGGPHIKVFDGANLGLASPTGGIAFQFMAYDPNFTGGVYIAVADVNADGFADIITGAGAGGGPHVQVFSPFNGLVLRSFFAYSSAFLGGVRVAAGHINPDAFADIVTAPGTGGGPHVRLFDGLTGGQIRSFMAYDSAFTGGVYVAVGDVNFDGWDDVITGAGEGGGPFVQIWSGFNGSLIDNFDAYDSDFRGGTRVAAGDLNGDGFADLVTTPGRPGGPFLQAWNGVDGTLLFNFNVYSTQFTGGVFVGVG